MYEPTLKITMSYLMSTDGKLLVRKSLSKVVTGVVRAGKIGAEDFGPDIVPASHFHSSRCFL
jgi:hypothetical protein